MTPKTLTCVVVDDEQSNLDVLVNYVNQIPYLELKATFVKPLEALVFLLKTPTDLLITDINMPNMSGIQLYECIVTQVHTQVIFISGYIDKIAEALELCVTDCIRKPVSFQRFENATQKALLHLSNQPQTFDDIPTEILKIALKHYEDLSESEKKVLALIAKGKTTKEIAELVFISKRTVESPRLMIRKKLKLLPEISLSQIAKFITESVK